MQEGARALKSPPCCANVAPNPSSPPITQTFKKRDNAYMLLRFKYVYKHTYTSIAYSLKVLDAIDK